MRKLPPSENYYEWKAVDTTVKVSEAPGYLWTRCDGGRITSRVPVPYGKAAQPQVREIGRWTRMEGWCHEQGGALDNDIKCPAREEARGAQRKKGMWGCWGEDFTEEVVVFRERRLGRGDRGWELSRSTVATDHLEAGQEANTDCSLGETRAKKKSVACAEGLKGRCL